MHCTVTLSGYLRVNSNTFAMLEASKENANVLFPTNLESITLSSRAQRFDVGMNEQNYSRCWNSLSMRAMNDLIIEFMTTSKLQLTQVCGQRLVVGHSKGQLVAKW